MNIFNLFKIIFVITCVFTCLTNVSFAATLPTAAKNCATENGTCTLPTGITATVYYGAVSSYAFKSTISGSVSCNNTTFGDPIFGTVKACFYIQEVAALPTGTITCAGENATCVLPSGVTTGVYFGTNSKYFLVPSVSGSIACNNTAFGDPVSGKAKTCLYLPGTTTTPTVVLPTGAITCVTEGNTCTVPNGTSATVYYGANGKYFFKSSVVGNLACNNTTFGDPIPGTGKACAYVTDLTSLPTVALPVGTTTCASEGGTCTLPSGTTATVYYGAGGKYFLRTSVSGSIACSNTVFNDPIFGTPKACSYMIGLAALPTGATACAKEGGTCVLPSGVTATVYYGASGKYFFKAAISGNISCHNTIFGDPVFGTSKACFYANTRDLAVTIDQPWPSLAALALSEVPVTVTNQGALVTNTPITLTIPLPAGVTAPLKFARNADAWVCLNPAGTITCTYNKSLAIGASTTVRLPIKPLANITGSVPGAFTATVSAVLGELNTANNTSPALIPNTAVATLNLSTISHQNYSTPLLNPALISTRAFTLPLPNAFAPFFKHTPNTTSVPGTDSYNLTIKQINTQILPPGFPSTPVYAYGDPARPDTFSYPAHTIAANSTATGLNSLGLGKPVKIKFSDSRDPGLAHLLPIDHSIHGAMASEPDIRSITHLHGIKNIDPNSDGYPEAWSSPTTGQIGNQFTKTSPTIGYNANPFNYGNNQESTLLWYHDHTLGMTRLNVYAGLAGLYQLRDSNEQNMITTNKLPNDAYEIPLVLQDRMFKPDGSLAYPDLNPTVSTSPKTSIVPEFYGQVMLVNGVAWPFLEVEPRRYRFRILNGSNARFYTLQLSNKANFQVIGTEGGFLNAPVTLNTLTIAPAERYDIIIDFSTMNNNQPITLTNSAVSPFPGDSSMLVTANLDGQIMQFRVNQALSTIPNNPLPTALRPAPIPVLTPVVATRQVLLAESTDNNGRILPVLGTLANGILGWTDAITEAPKANTIETWEIFNETADAHPIHLHGGHFQIVNRQSYALSLPPDKNHAISANSISFPLAANAPAAQELGWKDTVISYPGQVTRIKVKFENAGLFVWHCHILEHEDHDMMRPMLVQ